MRVFRVRGKQAEAHSYHECGPGGAPHRQVTQPQRARAANNSNAGLRFGKDRRGLAGPKAAQSKRISRLAAARDPARHIQLGLLRHFIHLFQHQVYSLLIHFTRGVQAVCSHQLRVLQPFSRASDSKPSLKRSACYVKKSF